MVKVHTIEMLEHSAKNFPNVKAHADMINGALVGFEDGITTAPTSGEKLYVVMNVQRGDKEYDDAYKIAKDESVNLFDLKNWEDKELDIPEANLEGDYSDIVVGTELTFDDATFKFKAGTATSGDISFTVTKLWGNMVNGFTVKIGVKA